MAARGPQNVRRGLERGVPLGFGALLSHFAAWNLRNIWDGCLLVAILSSHSTQLRLCCEQIKWRHSVGWFAGIILSQSITSEKFPFLCFTFKSMRCTFKFRHVILMARSHFAAWNLRNIWDGCLLVAILSCCDKFGAYISWGGVLVNTHFVDVHRNQPLEFHQNRVSNS